MQHSILDIHGSNKEHTITWKHASALICGGDKNSCTWWYEPITSMNYKQRYITLGKSTHVDGANMVAANMVAIMFSANA